MREDLADSLNRLGEMAAALGPDLVAIGLDQLGLQLSVHPGRKDLAGPEQPAEIELELFGLGRSPGGVHGSSSNTGTVMERVLAGAAAAFSAHFVAVGVDEFRLQPGIVPGGEHLAGAEQAGKVELHLRIAHGFGRVGVHGFSSR